MVIVSPVLMSPSLVFHDLLAGLGVEGDGVVVQPVEDDLAVGVGRAAVHHVAAGHRRARRGSVGGDTST